jgi:hypothetical protein
VENEPIVILTPEDNINVLVGCSGGVGTFGGTATY